MVTLLIAFCISFYNLIIYRLKLVFFVNLLWIVFIFLLIAFNRQNNDFNSYQEIFINPFTYSDIGYSYLIELLKFFGGTGHESVLLIFALLFVILAIKLILISRFSYIWFFLYFVFLLPLDITQIRFGLASFLVLYSILLYFDGKILISYIVLAVAISFHFFVLILSVLMILARFNFITKRVSIATFVIFSLMLTVFNSLDYISSIFPVRTLLAYQSEGFKLDSILFWSFPVFVTICTLRYFESLSTINSSRDQKLFTFLINISILSLGFSYGLVILFEFNRLYRFIFFILFLSGVILLRYLGRSNKVYLTVFLMFVALSYGLYYSFELDYDSIYWGF